MRLKSLDLEQLLFAVETEKEAGNTIICTCGCFDIFHIGHLEFLQESKKLGGKLIVGINSDESIKTIKNRTPLFTSVQRRTVIAALDCVDYAFIFNEATFIESLIKLKPHIFVKGIDYKGKTVLEAQTAQQLGIRMELIGDYKKSSSTEIRDRLIHFYDMMHHG